MKTRPYISILLLPVLLLALSACSPAQPQSHPDWPRLEMEMAGDKVILALAGKRADTTLQKALRDMRVSRAIDMKSWTKSFAAAMPEGKALAPYFASRRLDLPIAPPLNQVLPGGYLPLRSLEKDAPFEPDASNETVLEWLEKEMETQREKCLRVIRGRLDAFGVKEVYLYFDRSRETFVLETPEKKDLQVFTRVLQQGGNLNFWKTRSYRDVFPTLTRINEFSKTIFPVDSSQAADTSGLPMDEKVAIFKALNPFFGAFDVNRQLDAQSPYVGYARLQDTAKINEILRQSHAETIIRNMSFLWEAKPEIGSKPGEEPGLLGLVGIQDYPWGEPALRGDHITDARMDFSQYNSQPVIMIQMDKQGGQTWAELTRAETGNSIAIVQDGKVITAPRVNGEIRGGRSQIDGNFTPEEAQDLARILNAGSLPVPLRIIDTQQD